VPQPNTHGIDHFSFGDKLKVIQAGSALLMRLGFRSSQKEPNNEAVEASLKKEKERRTMLSIEVGMGAENDPRIGAVILAAGKSSRMGEPKQLLPIGEKNILQKTLENVRAANVDDIVLVLGFAAERIAPQVGAGVKIVVNDRYEEGMGGSLRTGLGALDPSTQAALIVLADQPFVQSKTLDQLIGQYRQSFAQIFIPMYRGFRGNPVLLDRSVFPEVMALNGEIGCRAIFGDHLDGIIKVPVDDIGILLDIDNRDDFRKLQHFGEHAGDEGAFLAAADLRERDIPEKATSKDYDELIVIGAEPVAVALVKLARVLEFRVTVVDPLLSSSELPGADNVLNVLDLSVLPPSSGRYVVVASGGKFDEEGIEQALAANSKYVALVANQKRAEEIRRRLQAKGHVTDQMLRAPAGLNINAKTSAEIALSILAEIVSLRRAAEKPGPNR
jgi:molybdenum cofactor cytidylyltransferase